MRTYVALPSELMRVPAEPVLTAGEITNDDAADYIDAVKVWGRGLAAQLREIAGLQPKTEN